jgi:hypothetical protein
VFSCSSMKLLSMTSKLNDGSIPFISMNPDPSIMLSENDTGMEDYCRDANRTANVIFTVKGSSTLTVLKDISAGEECFRRYGLAAWWATVTIADLPQVGRDHYEICFKKALSLCDSKERY